MPAGPGTAGRPHTRHLARKLGAPDGPKAPGTHARIPSPDLASYRLMPQSSGLGGRGTLHTNLPVRASPSAFTRVWHVYLDKEWFKGKCMLRLGDIKLKRVLLVTANAARETRLRG